MKKYNETLRGWGHPVFQRDNFVCRYCGYDGKTDYRHWMQLSVDHIMPRNSGGTDAPDNMLTCCKSCNSITSRMEFPKGISIENIIEQKKRRVAERHAEYRAFWDSNVRGTVAD